LTTRRLVAAAVFLLVGADLTRQSRDAPLHVDEPRMLNRGFMAGRLYRDYLRTGSVSSEWLGEAWQARKPPLGNVIVGLGLWLGRAEPPAAPYEYDWLHDYAWNAARGQVPSAEVLRAGRRLVPWLSAAAAAALFLVAAGVGGIVGGLVAVAVFHHNPIVRLYGPRALADMPMMAFSLWSLWYLARRVAPAWDAHRASLLTRCAALGLLVGLATATKQNGALMACVALVTFGIWGAGSASRLGGDAVARAILAATVVAAVSYGLFVLVNPVLHPSPLGRTLAQIEAWNLKFAGHWKARPEFALRTLAARTRAVARVIAGNAFGTLGYPYVTAFLVVAGAVTLALERRPPPGERSLGTIVLIWSAVTIAVVTAWIPLDWDRYYLPVIAVMAVLVGALGRFVSWPGRLYAPRDPGTRMSHEARRSVR